MSSANRAGNGEYKLPLFNHTVKLKPIPGQPEGVQYVLCTDISEPKNGLGYVAELTGKRTVRLLAWISNDDKQMHVYGTNVPFDTDDPDRKAQLHYHEWADIPGSGSLAVMATDGTGREVVFGEMQVGGNTAQVLSSSTDLGPYGKGAHPMNQEMAGIWLAAYYLPVLRGETVGASGGRIGAILHEMQRKALPDALDEIIWRGATNNSAATDFDRFAARQLIEGGAGDVRPIAAENGVSAWRLDDSKMMWVGFDPGAVQGLQRDVLLSVESALNRISFADLDAREIDNDMGMVNTLNERLLYKSTVDAYHMWGKHADFVKGRQDNTNDLLKVRGTEARKGGNWDTMTRFIDTCEHLMMPHRLEYRIDVNARTGEAEVLFGSPIESMFPSTELVDGQWVDAKASRASWVSAYTLRLAGLLAEVAFTSGMNIAKVHVTANRGSLEGPTVLSLTFDRTPFLMGVLPAYINGLFDNVEHDLDPDQIMRLLQPAEVSLQYTPERGLASVPRLDIYEGVMANRVPLWEDKRPVPEDLVGVLRADQAWELDVLRNTASISGDEINQIMEQNQDSPVSAAFELESVVMQLEGEAGDHGDRKPLYCEGPAARMLVSMAEGDASTRYWKAPDAMFNAQEALRDIECDAGHKEKSLAHAQEMIRIAPTTARSYVSEALTYADSDEDYPGAITALMKALPYAVMPMDASFCYYRLAYALWKSGNPELGMAVYAMLIENMPNSQFQELAKEEIQELLGEMPEGTVPPTGNEIEHKLMEANITLAPSKKAMELLAQASIRLTDEGFPFAIEFPVGLLGITQKGDVLPIMRRCLRDGVLSPEEVKRRELGE